MGEYMDGKRREFARHLDLDFILEWVREHLDPDDVFEDEKLEKWATDNGFTKESR